MKRHRIDPPAPLSLGRAADDSPETNAEHVLAEQSLRDWHAASRRRTYAQAISLVLGVLALACYVHFRPFATHQSQSNSPPPASPARTSESPATTNLAHTSAADEAAAEPTLSSGPDSTTSNATPESSPPVTPTPPATPMLDQKAIAEAEGQLDAASRDRARAEHRAAEAARLLSAETSRAAVVAVQAKKLAFQIHDPSTRLAQANARGGFLKGERDKLAAELATLRAIPRPKSASILTKSPVARPAQTDEFHFELQHNRIAFIDLNRLIQATKADAQLRIRMSDSAKEITSKVGPIGAFSLAYELVRSMPNNMDDLMQHRRFFDFKGWEIIPEYEKRGETYESSRSPISEFNRAINRVNPERGTITLWVYPDSFALFRQIRDDLTTRGFSVAARPLPNGMTIRGSPMGTQSAAQ